ncbi:MAG: hypothetical protein OEX81_01045 [Candidatus Pacebacteria bacterium]|nr:hypothetical protein [Candidatus Paceibacterota bacterium]
MKVWINGQYVTLSDDTEVGQGNEAYVHKIGQTAFKRYKRGNDPSYSGKPNEDHERNMAEKRLEVLQVKLPQFPTGLPDDVIKPQHLGYDRKGGTIVAYSMPMVDGYILKQLSKPKFAKSSGVTRSDVVEMFRHLRDTVQGAHENTNPFVFSDFTSMNTMKVNGKNRIAVIDIDAGQWGSYLTPTFTARYVDPLHCDPNQTKPMLILPHNANSDWYGYHAMLWELLTFVPPFGGSYKNEKGKAKVLDVQRPMLGISIFNPLVRYPKSGVPFTEFPMQVQDYFREVFEEGRRGYMPDEILEAIRTGKASVPQIPVQQQAVVIRGNVTATLEFTTRGTIVSAVYQNRKLMVVYHENGKYRRENGQVIVEERLQPYAQAYVSGDITLIANEGRVNIYEQGQSTQFVSDTFQGRTLAGTNSDSIFLTEGSHISAITKFGLEQRSGFVPGRSQFWTGEDFGFGFYRVGALTTAFIFDTKRKRVNDSLNLRINGLLLDAHATISKDKVWLLFQTKEGSEIINHCIVYSKDGKVLAQGQTTEGENNWLGQIRQGLPVANFILLPTDNGIVKVEIDNDQLVETQSFPDTEPFVNDETVLLSAKGGIYAVSEKHVHLLKIK